VNHPLGLGPLDRSHRNAFGALDVLGLRSRGFGDVHCTTTNHRAAGSVRHEFRKGHPNRHKLLLSVASSGGS
jgi:hypothetical protein